MPGMFLLFSQQNGWPDQEPTMHIETLPVTPAPATPSPQKVLRGRLRQLAWITAVTLSVAFWVGLYFLVF
jgi:hypothetical protein